jgi:hypothetical protein
MTLSQQCRLDTIYSRMERSRGLFKVLSGRVEVKHKTPSHDGRLLGRDLTSGLHEYQVCSMLVPLLLSLLFYF